MASYTSNVKRTAAAKAAERKAKDLGLTLTSAWRSPDHDLRVGGSGRGYHTKGQAYDLAGPWKQMDKFAAWARDSKLFRTVLWQTAGHYDHVHVSWTANSDSKWVDRGDRGPIVAAIQKLSDVLKVDGIFGPETENWIINFQKENGLKMDGIVGPNTWNELTGGGGKLFS